MSAISFPHIWIKPPSPILDARGHPVRPSRSVGDYLRERARRWVPEWMMAAVEGRGQVQSDGKGCANSDGKLFADGPSNEKCKCTGCANCSGGASLTTTLTLAGLLLCSGCIKFDTVDGIGTPIKRSATVTGSINGTYTLTAPVNSCVWSANDSTGKITVNYYPTNTNCSGSPTVITAFNMSLSRSNTTTWDLVITAGAVRLFGGVVVNDSGDCLSTVIIPNSTIISHCGLGVGGVVPPFNVMYDGNATATFP